MKKLILAFSVLIFISNCNSNGNQPEPITGDIAAAPDGQAIYKKNCVACHGLDGKMGFAGAKDLTQSNTSMAEIEQQVTKGKGAMAAFEKLLTTEEIKAVSKYVYELR
ncbi:MAG: cytochrome c [Chitinophagales bacterium]|nr:cytochrome c [Chitinophagales bacterium]